MLQNEGALASARATAGEVRGLFTTFRANIPQLYVDVDRAKVKSQNIPLTSVFDTLGTFLGSSYVNDFNFLGRMYRVNAQGEARLRATAADIAQLKTRNAAPSVPHHR